MAIHHTPRRGGRGHGGGHGHDLHPAHMHRTGRAAHHGRGWIFALIVFGGIAPLLLVIALFDKPDPYPACVHANSCLQYNPHPPKAVIDDDYKRDTPVCYDVHTEQQTIGEGVGCRRNGDITIAGPAEVDYFFWPVPGSGKRQIGSTTIWSLHWAQLSVTMGSRWQVTHANGVRVPNAEISPPNNRPDGPMPWIELSVPQGVRNITYRIRLVCDPQYAHHSACKGAVWYVHIHVIDPYR